MSGRALTVTQCESYLNGLGQEPEVLNMSEKYNLQIRDTITLARAEETASHALEHYIEHRLPSMHPAIELPKDNTSRNLLDFVLRYVEHAPNFLDALAAYMQEANIYDEASHLLNLAGRFFLKPPELIADYRGLHALTLKAYLAHRLMEEINDRLLALAGTPLTPMDMTMSNLVIHDLIGDKLANKLDMVVLYTVERSFQNENLARLVQNDYIEKQKAKNWEEALKKWPCLAGDNSISINLDASKDDL